MAALHVGGPVLQRWFCLLAYWDTEEEQNGANIKVISSTCAFSAMSAVKKVFSEPYYSGKKHINTYKVKGE